MGKSKKQQEPVTREQQLEAENARLRMENDYLKKLNALVAEREKSKKKTKSELSRN
jgi:transposase